MNAQCGTSCVSAARLCERWKKEDKTRNRNARGSFSRGTLHGGSVGSTSGTLAPFRRMRIVAVGARNKVKAHRSGMGTDLSGDGTIPRQIGESRSKKSLEYPWLTPQPKRRVVSRRGRRQSRNSSHGIQCSTFIRTRRERTNPESDVRYGKRTGRGPTERRKQAMYAVRNQRAP